MQTDAKTPDPSNQVQETSMITIQEVLVRSPRIFPQLEEKLDKEDSAITEFFN